MLLKDTVYVTLNINSYLFWFFLNFLHGEFYADRQNHVDSKSLFPSKILGELNPGRLHGKKALFMKIDLVEFSTCPHTSYCFPFKFW